MKRIALIVALVLSVPALADSELPWPKGSTSQQIEGLKCQLVIPADYDPEKEYSLVVVLHGAGGTETGMAASLEPLAKEGFVICAPKSVGQTWAVKDLEKVKEIIRHLMDVLSIGEGRLHGMGFSNGGWNLDPVVFDETLPFASACWMAAGCRTSSAPRRAKTEMRVIALVGENDSNRQKAEKTVDLLKDDVRSVECLVEPGIGHEFTRNLMPYYFWWIQVADGRFVPGNDRSFTWSGDLEAAKATMKEEKRGGFLWFYSSEEDADDEEARRLQEDVFFHPFIRHYGRQLVPIRLTREGNEELFDSFRLKETPAVVVLDKDFKKDKTFEGKKIKETSLAKALRDHARDKRLPE